MNSSAFSGFRYVKPVVCLTSECSESSFFFMLKLCLPSSKVDTSQPLAQNAWLLYSSVSHRSGVAQTIHQ